MPAWLIGWLTLNGLGSATDYGYRYNQNLQTNNQAAIAENMCALLQARERSGGGGGGGGGGEWVYVSHKWQAVSK